MATANSQRPKKKKKKPKEYVFVCYTVREVHRSVSAANLREAWELFKDGCFTKEQGHLPTEHVLSVETSKGVVWQAEK